MRPFPSGSNSHKYLWSGKYPLQEFSIDLSSRICELGKLILLRGIMSVELEVATIGPCFSQKKQDLFDYMGYFNSKEFMSFLYPQTLIPPSICPHAVANLKGKDSWPFKPHLFSDGAPLKKRTQRKRKACDIEVKSACRCIPFLFSIQSSNDIQTSPPPPHPHSPWNFWHIKSWKAFCLQRAGLSDCTRRARCDCDRIHLQCSACAPIRHGRHRWSTYAFPILNATQSQCHVPPTSNTDTQIHSRISPTVQILKAQAECDLLDLIWAKSNPQNSSKSSQTPQELNPRNSKNSSVC